jgi:hypothetical protein
MMSQTGQINNVGIYSKNFGEKREENTHVA